MRSIVLVCLLITMISCSLGSSNDEAERNKIIAEDIVQQSIEVHGGWEKWTNLKSISYSKTVILYDSSGAKESTINQYHSYQLKPSLSGVIWWLSESDTIIIAYANGEGIRSINAVADYTTQSKKAATKSFLSSFYVLFQPFKLLDQGTIITFVGNDTLEDGTEVSVVQAGYSSTNTGSDRWWYYFDKKTNKLVATMVNHPPTYSLINNIVYDKTTEILFNGRRKSYFVDSLRNMQYLRAEYFYDSYRLEFFN